MAALRAVCDLGFAGRQGAAHSAFPAADSSSLAAADLELLGSWSVRLAAWARSDPEAEASPAAGTPDQPATLAVSEPSDSDLQASAFRELLGSGLQNSGLQNSGLQN